MPGTNKDDQEDWEDIAAIKVTDLTGVGCLLLIATIAILILGILWIIPWLAARFPKQRALLKLMAVPFVAIAVLFFFGGTLFLESFGLSAFRRRR